MYKKKPVDVIENYRRAQQNRFPFTLADILLALIALGFLVLIGYITFFAKPELPAFLKLNTLTPTVDCSCLPTPEPFTATPDESQTILPAATNTAAPAATQLPAHTATPAPTATVTLTLTATLTPTETALPTETPSPTITPLTTFTYTVKDGETLSTIADRYGFTTAEVMAVNPDLKDANFIYVGQKIQIPRR